MPFFGGVCKGDLCSTQNVTARPFVDIGMAIFPHPIAGLAHLPAPPETSQTWMLLSQCRQTPSWLLGINRRAPSSTAFTARAAISLQSQYHCGFTRGSRMSWVREHKGMVIGLGFLPLPSPWHESVWFGGRRLHQPGGCHRCWAESDSEGGLLHEGW